MDNLLTVNDLAKKLKISQTQVYRLLKRGMPYVIVGDYKRFVESEVMEWLKVITKNQVRR